MKRSRCPHDRLYRERGPRMTTASVKDIDDRGLVSPQTMTGPVVVEVCERCGRRREIGFRRAAG